MSNQTALASSTSSFLSRLKANLKLQPFKVRKIGPLCLRRSEIPKDVCDQIRVNIDRESNLQFNIKALELGLTSDELHRQLMWTFLSE
jgi:hypothetical protein